MNKAYEPKQYEDALYTAWKESGYFNPDNLPQANERFADGEPFAIMMPPPNVTGVLHLGHALENTIMDVQVRYQRMLGKQAMILPGTDHAAVATQARVEDNLKKDGIENPREEFGREGLLEKIREYAEGSKATILSQVQKMGTSADWSRLAYTFDDERSAIVNNIFTSMYNDGLIYRGYRVVNWSIVGQSTSSNDELEYKERTTTLYTFKYSKDCPIPVATVLPETKLGDSAIAVHPEDERYKEYIGQTFEVDFGGDEPLQLHVIADENIDPEYGTGALGVTPAHSEVDYEMYKKNPEIGIRPVIGLDGNIVEGFGQFSGLPYKEARKQFVEWLRENDLLMDEEEITHSVSLSDRFKDEIWPMPMEQWFVAVDKEIPGRGKTLKQLMMEVVEGGLQDENGAADPNKQVTIMPERFDRTYRQWIENLHDWCISRQIWWGHRIPVWTRTGGAVESEDTEVEAAEVYCGEQPPEGSVEAAAAAGWEQDPDTLDTWFSSGMWTFSTLGGEGTDDFNKFHPTAWMQMGHEILRLWMARMIMFSTYSLKDIPFHNVYIHGMLRDKNGDKFSKSKGNGIDPLDVIEQYGTDALRLSLIKGIAPGADSKFYYEKVEDARNFVNKLWNVSRFTLMQEEQAAAGENHMGNGETLADKWIMSRLQGLIEGVSADLDAYNFSQASEKLYAFVWNEFADWYVEASKIDGVGAHTREVLETVLKLLHPVAPFVTEQIAQEIGLRDKLGNFLMVAEWPQTDTSKRDEAAEKRFETLRELIVGVRSLRAEYRIDPAKHLDVYSATLAEDEKAMVSKLARVSFTDSNEGVSATVAAGDEQIIVPLEGAIDVEAEQKRMTEEIEQLKKYISGLEGKLNNESYVNNAPAEIVEETRENKKEKESELAALEEALKGLQ